MDVIRTTSPLVTRGRTPSDEISRSTVSSLIRRRSSLIDYVGGEEDLRRRLIRAIGDPHLRFDEDKLRMLRAIRMAATFGFQIDPTTLAAIQRHAGEIRLVSAERIADELRRIFIHPHRRRGVELLRDSTLLSEILPEAKDHPDETGWAATLDILAALREPSVSVALTALLRNLDHGDDAATARRVCRRWKLSNHEIEGVLLCLANESLLRTAANVPWPRLQRVLIHPRISEMLAYAAAVAQIIDGSTAQTDFCHQQMALPPERLNPPPLISGDDLRAAGIPPGPAYKALLETVRDGQLNEELTTKQQALGLALQLWQQVADERE